MTLDTECKNITEQRKQWLDSLCIYVAKAEDQLSGVVPHLIEGGLSILQYADDTILFLDHNLE